MNTQNIVCMGEVLWDSLPNGRFLGGAPLNVAINLKNLGLDSSIISAVGNDALGKEALHEIKKRGLTTDFIQINDHLTGEVEVELTDNGLPSYVIHEGRAWDFMEASSSASEICNAADMIVFGSLAFRNESSASTLISLLDNSNGYKILDVNFRAPFYSKHLIKQLLTYADLLKVNEEEIIEMGKWFGLEAAYQHSIPTLCERFDIKKAVITLGDKGSVFYSDTSFVHHPRIEVKAADTVGAGDGFLAGVIHGLTLKKSAHELLNFANKMGAFVASSNGATPHLNQEIILNRFR